MSAKTACRGEGPRRRSGDRSARPAPQHFRVGPAQPGRHRVESVERRFVGGGQRARRARQRPRPRLSDVGQSTGAFYGWPFSYYGQHVDDRVKPPRPDLVAKRHRRPITRSGRTSPSLGLTFTTGAGARPAPIATGAFVGEHGSWNRKPRERLPGGLRALRRRPAGARSKAGRRPHRLPRSATLLTAARSACRSPATAPCWSPTTSAARCGG